MSDYTVVQREDVPNFMERYPGFGEMRFYTEPAESEQVAFTWRLMPSDSGGRGSSGHRHKKQEGVVFVISGTVTFKVGDEVFEAGPRSAVRIAPHALRSLHNDTSEDAEILLFSIKLDEGSEGDTEQVEDFWPVED